VANALAKRLQRREFTLEQAKERLRFFLESGLLLQQIGAVHPRALELMDRFGLPMAYDAHYLTLAEFQRCECWTADERLSNTVKKELGWMRWIGERQSGTLDGHGTSRFNPMANISSVYLPAKSYVQAAADLLAADIPKAPPEALVGPRD
jgi:hypothetical protein